MTTERSPHYDAHSAADRVWGSGWRTYGNATLARGRDFSGRFSGGGLAVHHEIETPGALARSLGGPVAAGLVLGHFNATEKGKAMGEATGGWLTPARAALALSLLARVTKLDKNSPRIAGAGTAIIRSTIIAGAWNLGSKGPSALSRMLAKKEAAASAALPPAAGAGPTPGEIERNPVPGADTRA